MMTLDLSTEIIGCAIDVHRSLGKGHSCETYRDAMRVELQERGLPFDSNVTLPTIYKGRMLSSRSLDFVVSNDIGVLIVEQVETDLYAWMRTVLKGQSLSSGLLISFRERTLTQGVRRVEAL